MPHKDSGTCRPGDIALIEVDIGIMTHEGIEPCTLVDAGILASPELQGLTFQQMIDTTRPTYIYEPPR